MDLLQEGRRWRINRQQKILARPEAAALQSPPVESSFPDLTARIQIPFPQQKTPPKPHAHVSEAANHGHLHQTARPGLGGGSRSLVCLPVHGEQWGQRTPFLFLHPSLCPSLSSLSGSVQPPLPLSHLPSIQP